MTRLSTSILTILCFLLLHSCQKEDKLFVLNKDTGIKFTNTLVDTPELNILSYLYYYNGAGVALADFNNDGLSDIYFTSNQDNDALYLNNGSLKFSNVSVQAGISNKEGWTTGVTHVDINNDGLLDIYVCKVSNYKELRGHNLLYVNQGNNDKGVPIFKESSAAYGLDFAGFSTQAAFFDYDLDGDLDMYLLNHSVHPNRTYGKGSKRQEIDWRSGDKLFKNNNGYYDDVTLEAGIFQGKIGYGLGIAVGDLNADGYPDIYVGNDFFENDYLYLNNQDGTFRELITSNPTALGHTSHYSMGNIMVDLNNDSRQDIISLDMLPEDLKTYNTSGLEYPFQTYTNYLKNGYAPQFMQNTLHVNMGNENFVETAFASGIAATEWSWSPVAGDFDNDGWNDLYISNGIKGASNDMDYVNFIANDNIQKRISKGLTAEDMEMIGELPEKKSANYFFRNLGNTTFENTTETWFQKLPSFSNGTASADLDNDGDLDLVVNNVNEKAFVLENKATHLENSNQYLKVKFKGSKENFFAIGAEVTLYVGEQVMTAQNYPTKGYLSAAPPELHFGIGNNKTIDSLIITWPDQRLEKRSQIASNQTLLLEHKNANSNTPLRLNTKKENRYLKNSQDSLKFKHREYATLEFNRDPLIPFVYTNQGPDIAVADINQDTIQDLFICGGKKQVSALYIQNEEGNFTSIANEVFNEDSINEDTGAAFFDADNDGDLDLIVVSGGNEFKSGKPLNPRLYLNQNSVFTKDSIQFKELFVNASGVTTPDLNNDGFLDICITSNQLPAQYGKTPHQYFLLNNGNGKFSDVTTTLSTTFQSLGNIQDIIWADLNNDQIPEAIAVGHWMPISVLKSEQGKFELAKETHLAHTNGWWNTVKVADFDKDGDQDIIAGNWGFNTRFTASPEAPIKLYRNDFDDNGRIEPLITYFYRGEETLFATKDDLVKQLPPLNKKFLSYKSFAEASLSDFFSAKKIEDAYKKQVTELASCYFENLGNGTFKKHLLPLQAQLSSVHDMVVEDFNKDGYPDVFLAGNEYEVSTQLSRLDASHGLLLLNNTKGGFEAVLSQNFKLSGPVRTLKKIIIKNKPCIIAGINNGMPIILEIIND
ncbi:VCBS repeat-containing protein [Ascidiimonas sp. W6]|uniref:VCBS repeat-containing protein n=1 Tax=Ascidiimonas meishanensis TaxID=3128903 RepID=UPI0030EC41F1